MKTQSIITGGLALILSVSLITANAQSNGEAAVKILPTAEKGILKVLYAYDTDQAVEVKFFNDEGMVLSDRIKGKSFQNGFSKKYDIRQLKSKSFWIEVSSPALSVTYKMTESKDGQSFVPFLEKTTYNHLLVAANN